MKYHICLVFFIYSSIFSWGNTLAPIREQIHNEVLKANDVKVFSSGGGGVNGFEFFSDNYYSTKELSKEQLRKKLLSILDYELNIINSDKSLCESMISSPFNLQNIRTAIFIMPLGKTFVNYGHISYACSRKSNLLYFERIYDESKKMRSEEREVMEKIDPDHKDWLSWNAEQHGSIEHKESIEDALKICDPKKEHFPSLWQTIESN